MAGGDKQEEPWRARGKKAGARLEISKVFVTGVVGWLFGMVLASIAGVCLVIYPDAGFRGDLVTYLPVVLVFYCFGCLWMALCGLDGGAFWRAVMPSLLGGLIILGFVAVPAFASDSFRYRAAFQLNTKGTKVQDGMLVFDGDLEIMKAGNHESAAIRRGCDAGSTQAG